MRSRRGSTLALALLFDLTLGDPPNRFHPVAWMGTLIASAKRHAPLSGNFSRFAYGAAMDVGGAAAMAAVGYLLERGIAHLPWPLDCIVEAGLLKSVFTLRGLGAAARKVEAALEADDLPEARRLVSWHLVSRDTTTLSASKVAAAAVESVAENTSDGVVAPLFYYCLGGLPAAFAYRFINTADSMLGYHDPVHEWLGKVPARLDDLVNLLPARLAAALLTLAAPLTGANAQSAWRTWQRDKGVTASPNAGHPMSAMAGALDVELEKIGHYRLGSGGRQPVAADIGRSVRLSRVAVVLGAGLALGLPLLLRAFHREASK